MTEIKKKSLYFWSGLDDQGQPTSGSCEAGSVALLKYKLHKEHIICLKIHKQSKRFLSIKQWLNTKQTLFVLSQLAIMLKTGINLNKAIAILKTNQNEKILTRLYADLYRHLNLGQSLSQTFKNYPVLFDSVTLAIIKSGEISGHTDNAISQAGDYLKQKQRTSNELLTALLYPLILGLVTLGVLAIMIIFVIPQFETLYSGSNNQLPTLTRLVLSVSDFISAHLPALTLVSFVICLTFHKVAKLTNFDIIRHIPAMSRLLVRANSLRLAQTLNNLYRCGLPITDALTLCRKLSDNHRYQLAITQTLTRIHDGVELAQAMDDTDYFEPIFIQLIRTGEHAASLSNMLDECTHYYEKQLSDSMARLKIILEPLLIVVLGTVIGIILIAMYLPVFNIGSSF